MALLHGAHQLELWELTERLVRWSTESHDTGVSLIRIQTVVEGIGDPSLRSTLMALILWGWLRANEVGRALSLMELAAPGRLEQAGFYEELRSCAAKASPKHPNFDSTRLLTLAALCRAKPGSESFVDGLTAWLYLEAIREQAQSTGPSIVQRMLKTHADLCAVQSQRSES